jgi:hypothetical protein
MGFIYLMNIAGTSLFKIGVSVDPEDRLRTLRAIYGSNLRLEFSKELKEPKKAEREWHHGLWKHSRTVGSSDGHTEWFELSDHLRRAFISCNVLQAMQERRET